MKKFAITDTSMQLVLLENIWYPVIHFQWVGQNLREQTENMQAFYYTADISTEKACLLGIFDKR
jgi:hypothetical protein